MSISKEKCNVQILNMVLNQIHIDEKLLIVIGKWKVIYFIKLNFLTIQINIEGTFM